VRSINSVNLVSGPCGTNLPDPSSRCGCQSEAAASLLESIGAETLWVEDAELQTSGGGETDFDFFGFLPITGRSIS